MPNITLEATICLHSPQTEVCLLRDGTYILTDMTIGVATHLCSHQTKVYLLRAGAYLA